MTVGTARLMVAPAERGLGWLIVAVDAGATFVPGLVVAFGVAGRKPTGSLLFVAPLTLAIFALVVRHSFAFAASHRPRGAIPSLAFLALLVYAPNLWFEWNWSFMQACLMACAAMVLPRRAAAIAFVAPVIATDAVLVLSTAGQLPAYQIAYSAIYEIISLLITASALYGAPLLARTVQQLGATRAELASLAAQREQLRVSRDVHDLLGQSLSAVSLKGDLALRLIGHDPKAARSEVESLTGVARDALRGLRAVVRNEQLVSLRAETEGARALLEAASVEAQVDFDVPPMPDGVEEALSWAVREGVTNVLRHSAATWCSITLRREGRRVCLEIVNDGAPGPAGQGSGLQGLAQRAKSVAGSVSAERIEGEQFRLLVEVPLA